VEELGRLANEKMGGGVAQITAGPMRLNGIDALVAVCETEYEDERGMTFVWVPHIMTWRARRDVDPDEALGLIEWRRLRHERRTEGDDGG
jgi:hypothetical protein